MSVENVILSKEGYSEIEKICNFLSSIIVKNEAEAIKYETPASFKNFYQYESAYRKNKNIYDVQYSIEDLRSFFTNEEISLYKLTVPENLSAILNSTEQSKSVVKSKANKMLTVMQNKIISNYDEKNPYYRTFLGLPPTKNDIVKVVNLDMDTFPTEDGLLELHTIDYTKHPLTYEYLFVKLFINELLQEQEELNKTRDVPKDLTYANFIEKRLTPFFVRKAPDFTLFYYKPGILDEDEFRKFETAFNKARRYVIETLYISGLRDRYDMYPLIMIQLLITATFMGYCNLGLYNYSIQKYTRYDIYDILESEGLGDLKMIKDINLLRKIVENLDSLNRAKGSDKALKLLFNVINDNSLTVRSYKIKKNYTMDSNNNLKYDSTQFYDKSTDLSFEEYIEIKGKNATDGVNLVNYDEMVKNDDLWGGVSPEASADVKAEIKRDMKNKILQMSFDTLDTKYITLAKTFNVYEKSNEINSIYYMIFKSCYDSAEELGYNPLTDTELFLEDEITVSPVQLWAAQCYLSSLISELEDPDIIRPDLACFSSVYTMRSNSGLLSFINNFAKNPGATEIEITDPNVNKPIKDILGIDLIKKFLIKYNLSDTSTVLDIIDEFGDNLEIMYELADYMIASMGTLAEFESLYKIWDINEISYNYNYIYEGEETFTGFLRKKNSAFEAWLRKLIDKANLPSSDRKGMLLDCQTKLLTSFKTFLNDYMAGSYNILVSAGETDLSYLNDLRILFKEFLSIYLELYNVEQIFDITNIPRNLARVYISEGERVVSNTVYDKIGTRIIQLMKANHQFSSNLIENMKHSLSFEINQGGDGGGEDIPPEERTTSIFINLDIVEALRQLEFSLFDMTGVSDKIGSLEASFDYKENIQSLEFLLTELSLTAGLGVKEENLKLYESFSFEASHLMISALKTAIISKKHNANNIIYGTLSLRDQIKITNNKGEN